MFAIDVDGLSTFYHMPPCVSLCKRLATVFVCAGSMLALARGSHLLALARDCHGADESRPRLPSGRAKTLAEAGMG